MTAYPPAMPHGELEEIFPDIFFLTGTTRPNFMGSDWQFSRNMTVVREGGALTLINTVRLDDAGLTRLESLGTVANVVRLGAFHGMDDAFYRDRYAAKLWAITNMDHDGGRATDHELTAGGAMPFAGASLFTFDTSVKPEAILHVDREGGILISCDSLQNWVEADEYFSADSAEKMKAYGFIAPANIGPGWRAANKPAASEFSRLKKLTFQHLLPAHGKPLRNEAHVQLSATFARELAV